MSAVATSFQACRMTLAIALCRFGGQAWKHVGTGFRQQRVDGQAGKLAPTYNASMSDTYLIHTDGGARGNPGPAAFAFTIERPNGDDIEEKGFLGNTTNNVAEYTALIRALHHAHKVGGKSLIVQSDSELIVNQMNGKFKVKHPGLLPLYRQACELRDRFDSVVIRHIYREDNDRADRLYNEALDDPERELALPLEPWPKVGAKPIPPAPPPKPAAKPPTPAAPAAIAAKPDDIVRARALGILRRAARAWALDDDAPTPEDIWDQLAEVIGDRGA